VYFSHKQIEQIARENWTIAGKGSTIYGRFMADKS